jgi:hypothetical protein
MKRIFALFIFCLQGWLVAQTYYMTGRPFSYERNNAIIETANSWGFKVVYVGGDLAENLGIDSINNMNAKFESEQSGKLKGEDWLGTFFLATDKVEKSHSQIREAVKMTGEYLNATKTYEELIVLVQIDSTKRKRYGAYVLGVESQGAVVCLHKFRVKKRYRVALKPDVDCELPYEIPQNGILKKQ